MWILYIPGLELPLLSIQAPFFLFFWALIIPSSPPRFTPLSLLIQNQKLQSGLLVKLKNETLKLRGF